MTIQQTLTTSFKSQVFQGVHDFSTDTFKIALYTGASSIDATTTGYVTSDETTGTGYTAGGNSMTGVGVGTSGTTVFITFSNVVWTPASFTARGALIYNFSKGNKSVAVLDFGADKVCQNSFTVQMPENTATAALLRFT